MVCINIAIKYEFTDLSHLVQGKTLVLIIQLYCYTTVKLML